MDSAEKVFAVLGALCLLNSILRFLMRDSAYRHNVLLRPADRVLKFLSYTGPVYPRGVSAIEVAHTCFLRVGEASVLLAQLADTDEVEREWDNHNKRAYYRLAHK